MIISMKRVTLVAHKDDEARILKALQAKQIVQIIDSRDAPSEDEALMRAEETVVKLGGALEVLKPYAPKQGLLTPLPERPLSELNASVPRALTFSDELQRVARDLNATKAEIEKNEATIDSLREWRAFPADMQTYASSRQVKYFLGLIAAADVEKLHAIEELSEYQLFNEGAVRTCVVACPNAEQKSVANFLKSLDWTDFAFPKMSGTPAKAMDALETRDRELADKRDELASRLAEDAAGSGSLVADAYDASCISRDRALAAAEMSKTKATFRLEGWTPCDKVEALNAAIASVTDAYFLDVRDPNEDETPPSYVENNKFATPFEQVTNLYSPPDPYGMDPTPYMAPFYVLLFGLMLSDSGYGLILAFGCWIFTRLKKPTGMMGGLARVLFWGGISTIVWGVLVGTCFGLDFDTIFGTTNVFPLIVDPMADPISMLILCFGLGILHILFGVALKMKMSFARGDWQTAIFDNFSWILIVVGLILFAGAPMVPSLPSVLKPIGLVMTLAGVLMILLFKGRAKKNVFSRTASGLGELYQITSYLSDILSYARLFALGIATGVIAQVFNDLCGMLMTSPILPLRILGILVACALLVALHLFNLAINTLGAFVHCARLQYVEFYGKFYEPGGRQFKPLGYKTKHVRVTDGSIKETA